jgi:hypothetical protein
VDLTEISNFTERSAPGELFGITEFRKSFGWMTERRRASVQFRPLIFAEVRESVTVRSSQSERKTENEWTEIHNCMLLLLLLVNTVACSSSTMTIPAAIEEIEVAGDRATMAEPVSVARSC